MWFLLLRHHVYSTVVPPWWWNRQNGSQIIVIVDFGDHGTSAPGYAIGVMAVAQCLAMILNYLLLYSVRETFVFHVINMYLRHSTNYQSKTKNACLSYLHDLLLLLIQVMDFISCSYNWTLTCMAAQQNDSKIRLRPQAPVLMYSGIIFEIYPPPETWFIGSCKLFDNTLAAEYVQRIIFYHKILWVTKCIVSTLVQTLEDTPKKKSLSDKSNYSQSGASECLEARNVINQSMCL